ncbi:MAG: GDSL-type esterase/lipase family protein [Sphingorhabdus sp.]
MRNIGVYGALFLLIQALVACGPASQSTKDQPAPTKSISAIDTMSDAKLVVVFGDSLYAGYRLGPKEGFAPQLQAALGRNGVKARVHNAGVSGDTTAAGKSRLSYVLDNLERKPDLLVLGLGGNDMLRGIKPDETRANLREMMAEIKKRDNTDRDACLAEHGRRLQQRFQLDIPLACQAI